jgi:hypothetical protein
MSATWHCQLVPLVRRHLCPVKSTSCLMSLGNILTFASFKLSFFSFVIFSQLFLNCVTHLLLYTLCNTEVVIRNKGRNKPISQGSATFWLFRAKVVLVNPPPCQRLVSLFSFFLYRRDFNCFFFWCSSAAFRLGLPNLTRVPWVAVG